MLPRQQWAKKDGENRKSFAPAAVSLPLEFYGMIAGQKEKQRQYYHGNNTDIFVVSFYSYSVHY